MLQPMVCVVGSLNMDLVVRTPHLPAPGETISGGPFGTYPGGKGANQAVAAARMGGQVAMVGRVGDDGFGIDLTGGLQREGINVAHVEVVAGVASGIALISVQQDGQNTIVIAAGANGELTPHDIDAAREVITGARVLVLQLETPLPTVQHAAALARNAGVTVVLNPAPAQPLPATLLQLVDYLMPNQTEAAMLSGLPADTEEQALQAAQRLRELGAGTVVLTLGDQGALLLNDAGVERVAPHEVTAIDATAAGDAFVGAFAVALAAGHADATALRWGNAAGALAVTALGAQPSLPRRADVEALIATVRTEDG